MIQRGSGLEMGGVLDTKSVFIEDPENRSAGDLELKGEHKEKMSLSAEKLEPATSGKRGSALAMGSSAHNETDGGERKGTGYLQRKVGKYSSRNGIGLLESRW